MDKFVRTSVCWPTPHQELLLHAALGDRSQAIPAWERYFGEVGLDHLDEGSFRLLPQVYRNLHAHGYEQPIMGRLKGIYRQSWCKNQLLFHEMAKALRALHIAGIPTMLLKGAALSLAVYKDRGARPMRDFDVLVPSEEADRALELFRNLGWCSSLGLPMRLTPLQQRYRHATELVSPTGGKLDFHWHLTYFARSAQADALFWKAAWPVEIGEDRSQVLPPSLQLFHTCVHGLEGNVISPVRWVCDAMMTLRSGRIDWEQVTDLAVEHELVLPLRDALRYLQEVFQAPIPRSVVWRLESQPVSRFALMEYRRHLEPMRLQSPLATLVATYRIYLRGVRDWSSGRRLLGFPAYLADLFRLPGVGHLPGKFAAWLAQRLRGLFWGASASRPYPGDSATQS